MEQRPHSSRTYRITKQQMKIELIVVGKTDLAEIAKLVEMYSSRISHYLRFGQTVIPDPKNRKSLSEAEQKEQEGDAILRIIEPSDHLVLLDERGKESTSVEFAAWLGKRMAAGTKRLVFVIGGPYGFSEKVYSRANEKVSLSKMTFSHQIVRALFTEQLYRALTILNNEPYHHQ